MVIDYPRSLGHWVLIEGLESGTGLMCECVCVSECVCVFADLLFICLLAVRRMCDPSTISLFVRAGQSTVTLVVNNVM